MKKYGKKVIYFILSFIIVLLLIYLKIDYQKIEITYNETIQKAKSYHILTKSEEISFQEAQEKLKKLENNLKTQYPDIIISNINKEISSLISKNQTLTEEVTKLETEIQELSSKKESLTEQYNTLKRKKDLEKQEAKEQASTYQINGVMTKSQYPNYPTGCESVALYILLKFYGVNISVEDIINNLPQGGWLYTKDNIRYGGNPELEFVGSPYDIQSFGVYEGPIITVANTFKTGIINGRGNSLDDVLNIVKQGRPAMAWTTINLVEPYIVTSWTYEPTMEKINWYANEHAVVIIGFSDNYVIISDPNDGSIKKQSRSLFESRYNYLGKRNIYY